MSERFLAGVVSPSELYTLTALKLRLGLKEAGFRAARRAGLRVHYRHGRGYVLGQDWIDYVLADSTAINGTGRETNCHADLVSTTTE